MVANIAKHNIFAHTYITTSDFIIFKHCFIFGSLENVVAQDDDTRIILIKKLFQDGMIEYFNTFYFNTKVTKPLTLFF